MAIESPSDLTDTLCVEQNMSDGVLIENDRCSMVSKNPIPPGEEGQDSRQASSPTIEHTDSLGSLTLGDTDEPTTSTEVIQEDHDRPSKARQKRLELLAKLAANSQPKLGRAASKEIDLSTEEEKKTVADEWFEKKFGSIPVQKVTPTSELSQLKELLAKGEITGVYARRKMQETIMKKLSEKRRKEQQKRWETYKADNFIEDEQEEEEEILSDPESELSEEEPEPVEEEEELDELRKEKEVRKPRCEFLDDEAEESNEESDEPNDIGSGDEEKEDAKETKKLVTGEGGDNVEDGVPEEKGQHDEQPMCMERVESGSLDLVLPNSLSQWVDNGCTQSQCGSKHGTQKSNSSGTVDALGLCSTTFDTATLSSNKVNRSDEDKSRATAVGEVLGRRGSSAEILALCSGQFTGSELIIPQQSSNTASVSLVNEIDEELPRTARRRNKKIVLSDSEDERDDSDDEEKMKKSNVDVEREKSTEEGDDGNVAKDEIEKADKVSDNLSGDEKETMSNDDPAHEENFIEGEASEDSDEEEGEEDEDHEEGELNSSDDELGVFRRLQQKVPIRDGTKKKNMRSEYFDDEASLSGDDVGSDADEDDDDLDEYEIEEGDQDDLPDEETLKLQLQRQWMKQQQDDEERKLLYWKDQLLEDGDLHTETDRTFRFKLRQEVEEALLEEEGEENTQGMAKEEEIDGEDEETRKKRIDMIRWKMENKLMNDALGTFIEDDGENSPLMQAGLYAIQRQSSSASNLSEHSNSSELSRNSLLQQRTSLSVVIKQMSSFTGVTNPTKGLFISNSSKDNNTTKRRSPLEAINVKRSKTSIFDALN